MMITATFVRITFWSLVNMQSRFFAEGLRNLELALFFILSGIFLVIIDDVDDILHFAHIETLALFLSLLGVEPWGILILRLLRTVQKRVCFFVDGLVKNLWFLFFMYSE